MNTYWLTFTDGTHGCCQGQNERDAKVIAEHLTGKTVKGGRLKDIEAKSLPYPASPIIWQLDHPVRGKTPDFCYMPGSCAGRTACPRQPSCTS